MPLTRSFAYAFLSAAFIGALGPLSDLSGAGIGRVGGAVFSVGWCYAALPFFAGYAGRSKFQAAGLGVFSVVTAVLVYYVTKAFLGDFVRTDLSDKTGQTTYFSWGDFASMTAAWCVVGFLAGLVFGLAGWMAKGGQFSYPFRALVPAVVFAEMTMRLSVESGASAPEVVLTWEVVRAVAVVLGVAVVTWTIWRERRSRTQAGIGN